MKKISIVTVTYNCASVIKETMESIVGQDYTDKQIVVIDGGSEDGTLERLEIFSKEIDVLISEPDRGIFDAMNKSLKYVNGDYTIFINAGDRFVTSHVLSDVFSTYDGDDDLIYGDGYVQTIHGYRLRKADAIYTKDFSRRDMVFRSQGICHQDLFTKTSILCAVGFNLCYPLGADYDTTAKVFSNGNHSLFYCGIPISVFDDRMGGASHYKDVKVFRERCEMFDYTPTLIEVWSVYLRMYNQRVKSILELLFPKAVARYKSKKYQRTI